jgi:serine/threonine-protein kinase
MGVVYLARHPELERQVVLKALRRDLAGDASLEERFRREAKSAAAVHHQNVVALYDCFTWRGERFIAQEYVDGRDLASVLREVKRLAPRVATLVALELARGLEEIHARGIVHRDLKPSNVLLGRAGEVKIADFGIALEGKDPSLTQVGHAVGTPTYMSPEALLGERVDARSDLFGFGILLYEMLTGEPPFRAAEEDEGGSLLRQMQAGRYRSVRRLAPATPGALAGLVKRCLRAKPRRRPAHTADLRRALERQLGHPAPAESRAEIAAWLWERGVFAAAEDDGTRPVPAVLRRRGTRRPLRWAAVLALALAAAAAATSHVQLEALAAPVLARLNEVAQGARAAPAPPEAPAAKPEATPAKAAAPAAKPAATSPAKARTSTAKPAKGTALPAKAAPAPAKRAR